MTRFDGLFVSSAAPVVEYFHGRAASYRAPGGATTTGLTVLLDESDSSKVELGGGVVDLEAFDAVLSVRAGLLATAQRGGVFTMDDEYWVIPKGAESPAPRLVAGSWRCAVKRERRATTGRREGR